MNDEDDVVARGLFVWFGLRGVCVMFSEHACLHCLSCSCLFAWTIFCLCSIAQRHSVKAAERRRKGGRSEVRSIKLRKRGSEIGIGAR